MEIYKYSYDTKEFKAICDSNLTGKERDKAIDEYIKKYGEKVSIADYFNDSQRKRSWRTNYSYKCFGEVGNCIERLVKGELDYDDSLTYCNTREAFPEDLVESRTDWYDMKCYADGLAFFIDSLKMEIANGTIVVNNLSV